MEFHQVRYFLAAADHMNFTRAAEASGVSQPALTVAIQKLEAELGGPLFLREGRAISLTPLGQAMRTHLARIEETRVAAHTEAADLIAGRRDHVELGIMCTIGPRLIGPVLGAWHDHAPEAELVLHDVWGARATALLLSGAIDCALIARLAPLPERFCTRTLMPEEFELAFGPGSPLAGSGPVALADLEGARYIDRLRCEFRETVFDTVKQRQLTLPVVMRSEREDWIQTLVAAGQGVTMLPRNSVIVEGIGTRPVLDLPVTRTIELVTVRGRPVRPVVARFLDFLSDARWSDLACVPSELSCVPSEAASP